jgi:hypothetical protein
MGLRRLPAIVSVSLFYIHRLHEHYVSHDTLRRLMTYIVDLTLIMQNIFWLVSIYQSSSFSSPYNARL